jgi:hypothetical protein
MKYLILATCLTLGVSAAVAQERNTPVKPWTDEYQYGGKPSVAVPLAQGGQTSSSGGVPLKHPSKKRKLKEKCPRGASTETPKTNKNPSKDGEFEIAPKK